MAGPFDDARPALNRGDYAAALQIWRPLADQGNADAQAGLGWMYTNGWGVPPDDTQALIWLYKAADQENAVAQLVLALMYASGQGVPRDNAQALIWLRKPADQENAIAQAALAGMYAYGQGVPQDYLLAHMWFNLAASGASDASARERSVKNRDDVAAKMTPAQIAEAQRLASEWVQSHPSQRVASEWVQSLPSR